MNDPEAVYEELLVTAPMKDGRAYRAFYGPVGLDLREFVDGVSRLPGMAFTLAKSDIPLGMQLPRLQGASVTIVNSDGEPRSQTVTFELSAHSTAFKAVFVELAARLIRDVCNESSASSGILAVARRLSIWARFFDARENDGLSRSRQLGLLGELICLQRLCGIMEPCAAVSAWTGPIGTPHDFQTTAGAIEAKLSTSSTPERVRITSERQLDDSIVPWLGLFVVLTQESASGATSVPQSVDQVRTVIAGAAPGASPLFEERLLSAGYVDSDRAEYEIRVVVRSADFLHVRGDFPRLRPSELRSGVFAVSYEIPWSGIAPYRVADNEIARVFRASD
jgi:hypothetical protein